MYIYIYMYIYTYTYIYIYTYLWRQQVCGRLELCGERPGANVVVVDFHVVLFVRRPNLARCYFRGSGWPFGKSRPERFFLRPDFEDFS